MSLLFMASMCFLLIPEMVKALIFCLAGHSLSVWIPMVVDGVGIFGGFLLLILYIRKKQSVETPGFLVCLEGLLPALCAYMLGKLVIEFVYPLFAALFVNQQMLGIVLYSILTALLFILQGLAFFAFVIRCSGREGTIGCYIRRIYFGLPASVLVGIVGLMGDAVRIPLPFQNVAVHFLIYLAAALLMAGLFWLILFLMGRMAAKARRAPSIGLEFRAYNTFFTIGAVLLLGFSLFRALYPNPVREIQNELDACAYELETDLVTADLDGAVETADTLLSTLAIWKQITGIEETPALDAAVQMHPADTKWMYLAALYHEDTTAIERYLRTYGHEPELALALLDLYDGRKSTMDLTERKLQNVHKRAAISECVVRGYYTSRWVRPEDLRGRTLKFAGILPEYYQYEQIAGILELLQHRYQGGTATQALVDEALALAAEYPDNWMVQYIAAQVGSELTYDGAGHYEATGDAVLRYLDLYVEEKEPKAEEVYELKVSAAQILVNCYQYEKALQCLKSSLNMDVSGNAYMLMARCYDELDMVEECYETSLTYIGKHPDQHYALYYAALSALKLGMRDETLKLTSQLASALEDCESDAERVILDTSMYSLLQHISFNDNSQYTGYQYAFYEELTEEQWEIINRNPFFANYLHAAYHCFKGDLETALQAVEEILKSQKQLANAWYLKGSIIYNMQDPARFVEAVEAYRNAIAIIPEFAAAWYALANVYDGLGEYEWAIEACEHALALLPEQDHGEDWYGISIHCKNLLHALQEQVQ